MVRILVKYGEIIANIGHGKNWVRIRPWSGQS